MSVALLILLAVIVLSFLIIIHEFGHFIAAKKAGIWVEEFGVGLPPRVFGKKIGDTIYSVNLLPIGGFVRLHGENPGEVHYKSKAYLTKPKRKRMIVALAGILMNYIFALICFSLIYFFYSFSGIPEETGEVRVISVETGSPAEKAKIIPEDIIRKVDNKLIETSSVFGLLMKEKKGKEVTLEVERLEEGQKKTKIIKVTPRENPLEGQGYLGVEVTSIKILLPPLWQRPFVALYYGFKETVFLTKMIILGFASIFGDLSVGKAPEGVIGPLGITALIAHIARLGILPLVNFMGLISLNLALLNLVPFPPLDGARFVFIVAETLFGKKILPKVESVVNTVGIVLLLLLLLALTGREIPKLIKSGSLTSFVENIIPESP